MKSIVEGVGLDSVVGSSLRPILFASMLTVGLFLFEPAAGQAHATEAERPELVSLRTAARAYEHGEGVRKDPARAIKLYCDAARFGDAEAQFSLGWMYANGRGVTRNDSLASYLFDLAANQGHEHAKTMLTFVGNVASDMPECLQVKQAEQKLAQPEISRVELESLAEFVATTEAQKRALELVNKLAPEFGISPRLALAVIKAESNFDPTARSEKNAQGLMQLIPATAARFNVSKPFDPAQNVRGGLAYLRWLLAYFQGNVTLVAAAYNAGEVR